MLPAARPYGGGPLEWIPLVAGSYGPDGSQVELGLRAGDLVGRRQALLLVAPCEDPEASLHLRWRGSRWQPAASLFHLESQRGVALALTREWAQRATALKLELGALGREQRPADKEPFGESSAFFRLDATWQQQTGPRRVTLRANLQGQSGEKDGRGYDLIGTRWRLELAHEPFLGRPVALGLEARVGRAGGQGNFLLGGSFGSLLPESATMDQIEQPGLRSGILQGGTYEMARVDLRLTPWPLYLYGENYRFDPNPNQQELRLWGAEARWHRSAQAFLRIPAFELRAGLVEILEGPGEGADPQLYLHLSWKN